MSLDLVAIATAVLLLDHVARFSKVGDDRVRTAFGTPSATAISQTHAGIVGADLRGSPAPREAPHRCGASRRYRQLGAINIAAPVWRARRSSRSGGCGQAPRRRWKSRAAASRTSVSGARHGRGNAGSCAGPGTGHGYGWSDGIADSSGRTSHSYRIATVPWRLMPRGHGRSIHVARLVAVAQHARRRGQGGGGPWRPTSSTGCANSKAWASRSHTSRHLGTSRSRVARITHGLDSSLAGSRHPELPLSFR
jgi:hypothetical protein